MTSFSTRKEGDKIRAQPEVTEGRVRAGLQHPLSGPGIKPSIMSGLEPAKKQSQAFREQRAESKDPSWCRRPQGQTGGDRREKHRGWG